MKPKLKLKAEVVETRCKHMQAENQPTYATLAVEADGVTYYLRLSMWQYYYDTEAEAREVLKQIAEAINRKRGPLLSIGFKRGEA